MAIYFHLDDWRWGTFEMTCNGYLMKTIYRLGLFSISVRDRDWMEVYRDNMGLFNRTYSYERKNNHD